MKRSLVFLLLLLITLGCEQSTKEEAPDEFSRMMGYGFDEWKYVETPDDRRNLAFYRNRYERAIKYETEASKKDAPIPKIIHSIWLGPEKFPSTSLARLLTWIELHPNWKIKLWTDRKRSTLHPNVEFALIENLEFSHLEECFYTADNFAEKSNLLRYEILYNEGGVYVDHDVQCYLSFKRLNDSYDFYCSVEPPRQPIYGSSIHLSPYVIGAIPKHPMLLETMKNVLATWEEYGKSFPGQDVESTTYRISYRSRLPFDLAVKKLYESTGLKDIVFPAQYFHAVGKSTGIFANHFNETTWYKDEEKADREMRHKIDAIKKKSRKIFLFALIILIFNVLIFLYLALYFRKIRKKA